MSIVSRNSRSEVYVDDVGWGVLTVIVVWAVVSESRVRKSNEAVDEGSMMENRVFALADAERINQTEIE